MADKKAFVLRIDENIYKSLEKWASDKFRSVNGQIEWLLQTQLKEAGRSATANPTEDCRAPQAGNQYWETEKILRTEKDNH